MNEQEIKDFLYSDEDKLPELSDDFKEWKEKKKEAKQRFMSMQNLPYKVKVRKAEQRAIEFMEQMDE